MLKMMENFEGSDLIGVNVSVKRANGFLIRMHLFWLESIPNNLEYLKVAL